MESRAVPIIVRVAGLPCDAMDALASSCGERADALDRLHAELQQLRGEMVNRLHAGIRGAEPDQRHALLAVKRDCHNGRPLAKHRESHSWRYVEKALGPVAEEALELEHQCEGLQRDFVAFFAAERRRQHGMLAALAGEPAFRCGLAMANPRLDGEFSRLRQTPPEAYARKERRLAATLLRYVSRAALKLSPFSTFTCVGLAQIEEGDAPPVLTGGQWRRHSLVRVRRHILDRCQDLLLHHRPWRRNMRAALNDSAVQVGDGRWMFRRPAHFQPDALGKVRFQEESLVKARLGGPLFRLLTMAQPAGEISYGELQQLLLSQLPAANEEQIERELDHFVEIGFLQLLPPWSADEPHLERAMIPQLRQVGDPGLEAIADHLEKLVTLEDAFLLTAYPSADLREMAEQVELTIHGAAAVAGIEGADAAPPKVERELYHDVWCGPGGDREQLLRIGRAQLDRALRSVEPLVRYSRLFDHRTDFLVALDALLREAHGPGYRIPILEAFELARPLWQAFIKFQVQTRDSRDRWRESWNPYGLAEMELLATARDNAHAGMEQCLFDGSDGRRVDLESLRQLLNGVPDRFVEGPGGACLFLQPASADGSLWVLNRMKEGTARFASRYTPLMPAALRERYAAGLSSRATFDIAGEPGELLDVYCVQGDTLNVHAVQTRKVLTLPGVAIDVPSHRRRSLGQLVIARGGNGFPQIRDRDGARYLPVHLGVCYHDYLPTMVKFLCAFGPSEMGAVFPEPLRRSADGVTVQERTVAGNIVIHRKSWRVPAEEIRRCLDQPTDHEAYLAIRLWHTRRGIPERVFASERAPHPILGFRYQPQYVDFASPIFLPLVRAMAASEDKILEFVEQLPLPELFPKDAGGRRWSYELLVDSLCLREPHAPSAGIGEISTISRLGAIRDSGALLQNAASLEGAGTAHCSGA